MGSPAVAPRRAPAPRRKPPAKPRRKPAPRRASARPARSRATARPHPRSFAQPARAGAALIPNAAVGAVGAVRDISDSSLIVRLTAGRGWIAVLCFLLGGIVALNVLSLSINATSGRVTQATEEYERQNSALRAELAEKLSAGRVQESAAALGLAVPAPDQVGYLDAHDGDLDKLADLLSGETVMSSDTADFVPSGTSTGTSTTTVTPSATPTTPTTGAPVTATPAPAATPAPVSSAPPSSGGGGATGGVGL